MSHAPGGAAREGPLGPADEDLIRVAALQRERAYAPYSGYKVGAAVRTKRNKIHAGANVENASYGLTICAERTAVFAAVNAGDRECEAIAIVVAGDELPSPCGACRQVLHEFGAAMRVVLATTGGRRRATTLGELLPDAFGPERLPVQ
ncbi:MAG TPA: cytidine deaminase [Gaiellaceae bacterium]|nr:cytidine deaminase [Gaiellaceae bacterium]